MQGCQHKCQFNLPYQQLFSFIHGLATQSYFTLKSYTALQNRMPGCSPELALRHGRLEPSLAGEPERIQAAV